MYCCFVQYTNSITSVVKDGTYILLGAAVVLNFLCQLITRASASAIEDRENRLRGDVRKLTKEKQNKKFFTVFVCNSST